MEVEGGKKVEGRRSNLMFTHLPYREQGVYTVVTSSEKPCPPRMVTIERYKLGNGESSSILHPSSFILYLALNLNQRKTN